MPVARLMVHTAMQKCRSPRARAAEARREASSAYNLHQHSLLGIGLCPAKSAASDGVDDLSQAGDWEGVHRAP